MMGSSSKDDVDRLFACFKCGTSTPESALSSSRKKRKKALGLVTKEEERLRKTFVEANSTRLEKSNFPSNHIDGPKQISPVIFYGSPHGIPAKKPATLLRLLREIQIDLKEQNVLGLRKEVWATFPKLDQAMRFAGNHSDVRVFSYQDHLTEQRRFLASSYSEFWRRYTNMEPKFRHHYEVIQECLPCHLYFDLEYSKIFNREKNGDEMVEILLEVLFDALYEKYLIQAEKEWIIELDSTTQEKFSRHLIIRIPGTAFKDNSHLGAFVGELCTRISSGRGCDLRMDKLYVSKDANSEYPSHLFLDTAVYTRNRCFRLALSSKAGKSSVLLPSGRFKCANLCEEEMFKESLICRLDVGRIKLLTCKMDSECIKTLHFDSELNDNTHGYCQLPKVVISKACISDIPKTFMTGKSPFPALDSFVESIASFGNVSGQIRSWYWFSEDGLVVYSMSKSRYCEHIDREHKSNHVMYIVDFKMAGYYQKCYDPDCKGFRSPLRPLPRNIIPDDIAICNLTNEENHLKVTYFDNRNFDPSATKDPNNIESCHKDQAWWLEAIKFAENAEKTTVIADFGMVKESWDLNEDDWWLNADKSVSLIEQQINLQQLAM